MIQENDRRILVVETEPYFQKVLKILLQEMGFIEIIIAGNFDNAIKLFKNHEPDLALIDIEIGVHDNNNGVKLVEVLNSFLTIPIVFITSNYNASLYEKAKKVNPIAFINKEVSLIKLKQVIELGLIHNNKNALFSNNNQELELMQDEIFVKIGNVYKKFFLADIDWFSVDGKYAYAKIGIKSFPLNLSLKDLEERLGQREFIRVHQSYMVNIKKIEAVNPVRNIITVNGEELPIGRSYKKNLLNRIQHF